MAQSNAGKATPNQPSAESPADPGLGRQVLSAVADGLKRFGRETGQAIKQQAELGSYEIGGLWTGDAYRGDRGLLSGSPEQPEKDIDPLDRARDQAREMGTERGREMSPEL